MTSKSFWNSEIKMVNNFAYHRIEELADKALSTVGFNEPPVSVEKIAEKVGFKIIPFEFHNNLSAVLKKKQSVIGVNKNHHPLRQRFSIAHELGHYLLGHEGHDDESFVDEEFDKPIPHEKEANIFAAALLMPKRSVMEDAEKNGLDIKRMARLFQVSEQAMTIRLLELNLIK
jgi:Zn-dependent peptidase ImmA (M78 family)